MNPGPGPILLGTHIGDGGHTIAVYSLKAGTRVRVFLTPEAYAAGKLVQVRDRVAEWFPTGPTSPRLPEVPFA